MKLKRLTAGLLAFVLAVGLTPATAFGDEAGASTAEGDGSTAEARDNSSLDTATSISINADYSGALLSSSDNDYYRFTLSSAGVVTLTAGSNEFVDESRGWRFYLRDESGDAYDYWDLYRSSVGGLTTQQIGLPAGTYYVSVSSRSYTSGTYHFRVNYEQRADWETEYNDNRSDADLISVGSTNYGSLLSSSDNDYYRFTLSSAGVVTLTAGSNEFVDESRGWRFYLRDESGDAYDYWDLYRSSVGGLTTQQIGLPAGTYYVSVSSRGYTSGTYHFRVNAPGNEPLVYGFSDVSATDWYATDDVLGYATSHGLLQGYGGTTNFGPYDPVTRGQIATILWRIAGEPSANAQDFSDVNYGNYYGTAIEWARSTGVISGYGDTNTFGPDNSVTRQELCVMLANYAERVAGLSISTTGAALDRIAGSNQVASWAREQMGWAVDQGIISGEMVNGTAWVNPNGTAQRCAVAKMASVFHRDVLNLG